MNENDNWTYHIKKNFNHFKNSVIDEMIRFYGEKYRDTIIQRLNDTNFIFYGTIKNNVPSKKQTFSGRKGIVFRSKEIDYPDDIKEIIKKAINSRLICFDIIYDFDNNKLIKYILIPLFTTDEDIIHEMIHSITYTPLYIDEEKQTHKGKSGLATSMYGPESLLEEVIAELEAKLIYKSLRKNNDRVLINEYSDGKSNCCYDRFIHLINRFHNCFFDEITYSRITLNKNSLINKIGKRLYEDLINCIGYYEEDLYSVSKDKYIPLINSTVNKMKENYKTKRLQ